jgi:2-polyprenyl-3-methyl-5-hydroxy-6-metoxy-1,4-benzoquinol methylase
MIATLVQRGRGGLRHVRRWLAKVNPAERELRELYRLLYSEVHDLDQSRELRKESTRAAFARQWSDLPKGEYLLSDPWFRQNVDHILCRQELLLDPSWFTQPPKKVLDAGCGNGRWAYGFCKLGANITCVDAAESAIRTTRDATAGFNNPKRFVQTTLETLDQKIDPASFDLAFSWGVLHHCESYSTALRKVAGTVKPGGMIYLYLYGRDSLSAEEELDLFRERVNYNVFMDDQARDRFLLRKARGNPNRVHNLHDIYAPLINRRFSFAEVESQLAGLGFKQITRTIQHTEIFVRAVRGEADYSAHTLAPKSPPYWFEGHHL